MRPSPDEVVAGLRAILKQEIAPLLPKEAQSHIRRVMAVLRDGRWNESAFDLLRENFAFAKLARDFADALGQQQHLRADLSALIAPLRSAADHSVPASFSEANEINRQLRDVLCRSIEGVRDTQLFALDSLCVEVGKALLSLRAA